MNASKRFEANFQVYQAAEAARPQRDVAAAQMATANGTVDLRGLEGGKGPQLEQQQQLDVSQAEADLHSANVDEYNIAAQIRLDTFSRHISEQEVTITIIEDEMGRTAQTTERATEQVTQASSHQQTGTKMLYWLLLF